MFQSLLGAERGVVRRQARSLDSLLHVGCFHLHWAAAGLSFLPPYPVMPIPVWDGQSHPPSKGLLLMGQDAHFLPPWNCSELVFTYCISCVPLPPRAQSPEDHPLCMPCRGPVPSDPMHKESYRSLLHPSQSHFCVSPYCTGRQGGGDWV